MSRGALAIVAAFAALAGGCAEEEVCAGGIPAPGTVCTLAGSGLRSFNGDGLDARETDLYLPSAVQVGPSGSPYIADFNNQRIRRLTEDGSIETVVGDGRHDPAALGNPAIESPLENPVDLDFDREGRLVFVSLHDPRVLMVDHEGILHNLAGIGEYGDSGDGGAALAARFMELTGIVIDTDGTIYLADGLASRVRAIAPGGAIAAVAGTGDYGYSGDGGPAVEAAVDYPSALALDAEGRLLIADSANHAVRRIEPDGTIVTIAGTGTRGFGGDGGPASAATLNAPEGLAVDSAGAIYVSDSRNHRIRRIDPDGTILTIAGTGESAWSGDGGPAVAAAFFTPARLSCDDDLLYVADQNNERVRVISLQ